MTQMKLIMPKMGESVAEATIINWLKDEGDPIKLEEPVLEIATDKVDSQVPSPTEGILKKKLFNENEIVKVGEPVAIIETKTREESFGKSKPSLNEGTQEKATVEKAEVPEDKIKPIAETQNILTKATQTVSDIPRTYKGKFYSPLVRNIAKEEGVSVKELDNIKSTGAEGRVTKKDILNYIENRKVEVVKTMEFEQAISSEAKFGPKIEISPPTVIPNEGDEIIEMDRMRKMIGEHMVMSKHVSPHVTSFVEADVTNIVKWRNKVKNQFLEREGEKITFTPLFIEALVKTIKDFPMINVSLDGNNIIKRKCINIGIATALSDGNLIVPVIKNADQFNLAGLSKVVNDLANRARQNKLKPDEIQGGTYTLTNVGTFGNVMGTPIINQPQVAILAIGSINKKPAVIETLEGDLIGIRHKMFLSHSYDHRIVDGALGGSFVKRVANYLEQFDPNRDF